MIDLPATIRQLIGEEAYEVDEVGMSDSTIMMFRDKVLKIQPDGEEARHEHEVMRWLKGKLPVPRVLGFERDNKEAYLLMTRLTGKMACTDTTMNDPEQLTGILAKGLRKLWNVDIGPCPYLYNLDERLHRAKKRVAQGLVAMDDAEPDTYGENGFKDPKHLLKWLIRNKPNEELAFSHGDFCLPNILIAHGEVSGYLDMGRAGIADKWFDIALCYRSLLHNYGGKYTGREYQGFNPERLFEKLNMEPDWEKIRYYTLLDELF
ncbi:MAG: APH(3') family aminoglycoside O-phosphotransferase [Candidatus Izemoplasmataceae bacterium]